MSQFVCLTGASLPETSWFSKACNASGEQIGHILQDAETTAIWLRQRSQPCQNTLFDLFLAYFYGSKRHYDPIYESVTKGCRFGLSHIKN